MSGGQAGFTLLNARPDIRVKQGAEARGGLLPHFCQSVCVCVCVSLAHGQVIIFKYCL